MVLPGFILQKPRLAWHLAYAAACNLMFVPARVNNMLASGAELNFVRCIWLLGSVNYFIKGVIPLMWGQLE